MQYMYLASFGEIASYVGYILLAILILLVMITVHELGHYLAGKIFKFGIEEFAIGFGPKIISKKKKNGELISLRAIPLGGFCSFKGEDQDDSDPSAFNNKKPWQRIIVLISGALMNYITAVLVIVLMFSIYGGNAILVKDIAVDQSIPSEYCFESKDVILKANGKNVYMITDLMSAIEGKDAGELVDFTVIRNGKTEDIKIKLRTNTKFKNLEDGERLYTALGVYYEKWVDGAPVNG
jgi:regulator of sigma E protease